LLIRERSRLLFAAAQGSAVEDLSAPLIAFSPIGGRPPSFVTGVFVTGVFVTAGFVTACRGAARKRSSGLAGPGMVPPGVDPQVQ
jgi:hypothetical protein